MPTKKRAHVDTTCFADEVPRWQSIASIPDNATRYTAIVNKWRLSLGSDDKECGLYIDPQSHERMFQTLLNCMEELDTYVTNHNDDPTNRTTTFVIPFVRDIVAREYSDDAISIRDQRHILFETDRQTD